MWYCTTKVYLLSSDQSSSIDIMTILYLGFDKLWKLIACKYYWPSFWKNVKTYVKGCNVYLTPKAVRHKPYDDRESLPILNHSWKDLLMEYVTGLPISVNWKGKNYDSSLVIVNRGKDQCIRASQSHLGCDWLYWPNLIVIDWGFLFTSKSFSTPRLLQLVCQRLRPRFLPLSPSHRFAISSTSNKGSQLRFINK